MTDYDRCGQKNKNKKHCSKMSTALQGLWLTERDNQVAGVQVVAQVAGAQVVDQVAGVQVLDQVAGDQVVVNQVAGTQVVDHC